MATRTALLNGNVINRDTDFSKYIEAVSEPGVIEGLAVSSTSVAIGKAFVKCERTNGDVIYALVYNNSAQEISGNGDVYIEIPQELIDNGELAPEDGSDIAEIKVGTMPSKNALKLATKNGSTITDERNIINKVSEINTITEDITDLDERVEALEEAGAIDHLEESGLVGELYTLNDTLFKQYTPTLENSTLDCNVSDTSANKQIHIQRIGSGVASNQLKLKVKMVGSSTQNLIVEVRKGVQVIVTANSDAYWYGNQVIASGSISYSNISTSYAEKTVTLNGNFGGTKGELLDIVVYMDTVNASNYYCVACDSTQYSEGFSYVAVNGSTRTRSKLMPYCISDGFAQSLLCKDYYTVDEYRDEDYPIEEVSGNSRTVGYLLIKECFYKNNDGYAKTVKVTGDLVRSTGSACYALRKPGSSTNVIEAPTVSGGGTLTRTGTAIIQPGEQLDLYFSQQYSSSSDVAYGTSNTKFQAIPGKIKKNPAVSGLTQKIVEIGGLGTLIFFGMNQKDFVNGIQKIQDCIDLFENPKTTTTATTGNITLGNAVGYIIIGDYKIPYYL